MKRRGTLPGTKQEVSKEHNLSQSRFSGGVTRSNIKEHSNKHKVSLKPDSRKQHEASLYVGQTTQANPSS